MFNNDGRHTPRPCELGTRDLFLYIDLRRHFRRELKPPVSSYNSEIESARLLWVDDSWF